MTTAMTCLRRLCLLALLNASGAVSFAAIIQVPEDQPTIQACVDAAASGDTCSVAPGVYFEFPPNPNPVSGTIANVIVNKAITVKSRELFQAVLDGGNRDTSFFIIQGNATIEGFVIQNAGIGAISRGSPGGLGFSWVARNLIIHNVDTGIGVDEWGIDPPQSQYSSASFRNIVVDHADRCYYTNDAASLDVRNSIASNCRVAFQGCQHQSFSISYSLAQNVTTIRETVCRPEDLPTVGSGFFVSDPKFVSVRTTSHYFPFLLRCGSPGVDAGSPDQADKDVAFPPSWNADRNDVGGYGGPGASVALTEMERQQLVDQLLAVDRSGSDATISWCRLPGVSVSDVVRGSVPVLQSTGGNFALATTDCLADNIAATSLVDSDVPSSGAAYWYLSRCDDCPGKGSYDVVVPSQIRSRDSSILASGHDCP